MNDFLPLVLNGAQKEQLQSGDALRVPAAAIRLTNRASATVYGGQPVALYSDGYTRAKSSTAAWNAIGLQTNSAVVADADGIIQTWGPLSLGSWLYATGSQYLTAGAHYYLSDTIVGMVTPEPSSRPLVYIGFAVSTTTLFICPRIISTSHADKQNFSRKLLLDEFSATATAGMTVRPSAEGTAWTANASGDTEANYCTLIAGGMTLNTTGVSAGTMYYSRAPSANFANGFTFEKRFKVNSAAGVCLIGAVRDNTNGKYVNLYTNSAANAFGISNGAGYTYFTVEDHQTVPHTWRLVMTSATAWVLFIDDELFLTGTTAAAAVSDGVLFGDLTNTAGVNVSITYYYVSYKTGAAVSNFSRFSATADQIQIGGYNAAALSVTLDTATAAGALGIDTGAFATSTWYAVWLLYGSSGTTAVFSLSKTFSGVTKPAGYETCGRLIAWVYTDASTATNFRYCSWSGDMCLYQYNQVVLNTTSPATTYTEISFAAFLPPGVRVGIGQGYIGMLSGTYTLANISLDANNPYLSVYFQSPHAASNLEVITFAIDLVNSQRRLFYKMPSGSSRFNIGIEGYQHAA